MVNLAVGEKVFVLLPMKEFVVMIIAILMIRVNVRIFVAGGEQVQVGEEAFNLLLFLKNFSLHK